MKCRFSLVVLVALFSFVDFPLASAGEKGNGGGTHVCGSGSVELYDLYEGRVRYGFKYDPDLMKVDSYSDLFSKFLNKISEANPEIARDMLNTHLLMKSGGQYVFQNDLELVDSGDSRHLFVDKDCKYQQIATWDDESERLFVDQEMYLRLSLVNKVAFRVHELLYKVARKRSLTEDSVLIRKTVAEVVANVPTLKALRDLFGFPSVQTEDRGVASKVSIERMDEEQLFIHIYNGDKNLFARSFPWALSIRFPELSLIRDQIKTLTQDRSRLMDACDGTSDECPAAREKVTLIDRELQRLILRQAELKRVLPHNGNVEENLSPGHSKILELRLNRRSFTQRLSVEVCVEESLSGQKWCQAFENNSDRMKIAFKFTQQRTNFY